MKRRTRKTREKPILKFVRPSYAEHRDIYTRSAMMLIRRRRGTMRRKFPRDWHATQRRYPSHTMECCFWHADDLPF